MAKGLDVTHDFSIRKVFEVAIQVARIGNDLGDHGQVTGIPSLKHALHALDATTLDLHVLAMGELCLYPGNTQDEGGIVPEQFHQPEAIFTKILPAGAAHLSRAAIHNLGMWALAPVAQDRF